MFKHTKLQRGSKLLYHQTPLLNYITPFKSNCGQTQLIPRRRKIRKHFLATKRRWREDSSLHLYIKYRLLLAVIHKIIIHRILCPCLMVNDYSLTNSSVLRGWLWAPIWSSRKITSSSSSKWWKWLHST